MRKTNHSDFANSTERLFRKSSLRILDSCPKHADAGLDLGCSPLRCAMSGNPTQRASGYIPTPGIIPPRFAYMNDLVSGYTPSATKPLRGFDNQFAVAINSNSGAYSSNDDN